MARFLGLDIGGANIKASDGERARSVAFPLWQSPDRLADRLAEIEEAFPPADAFAVTMTGELADCFETKSQGVDVILSAVEQIAGLRPIFIWQTGAEFISSEVAREIPLLVAAANWHALATWLGRLVPEGLSLLIDIGSTTTDVIPLFRGVPIPSGLTDPERLTAGELVYTGVRRTPLGAIARSVPFRSEECPVAAELFATMLDVFLILDKLKEDPSDRDTANGKPAIQIAAHDRLARMICCDRTEVSFEDAIIMAKHFADEQHRQIASAIQKVLSRQTEQISQVLVSGSGSFLAESLCRSLPELASAQKISVGELFEPAIADSACAFAVARLAEERVLLG